MRPAFAAVVLLGAGALAHGQPAKDPDPRFGVPARIKQYPQGTPKETLKTALALIDAGQYAYLAAHVLDPAFVAEAVGDRAKGFEAAAQRELAQRRDAQRADPDRVTSSERVPLDPKAFEKAVGDRAAELAFKQLLRDIEGKFRDDPQSIKDMRKLLREGAFVEADPTASVTHDTVKGRTLYFKKIGDRWFLENRQAEDGKKDEPKKEEPPKKDP